MLFKFSPKQYYVYSLLLNFIANISNSYCHNRLNREKVLVGLLIQWICSRLSNIFCEWLHSLTSSSVIIIR